MFVNPFNKSVTVLDGRVTVHDESAIASPAMDKLVQIAVFGEPDDREDARWLIWEIGQSMGVQPSSIHDLYRARGQGLCGGFTVPAMNIRGMTYDTGRALFRSAVRLKVGALIQEIARSEIAYTDQRPAEYVAVMLAAALREGFRGPIFIQGDHFQVNAKKFAVDPVTEVNGVKQLAREAIAAGFYNIDVDTSTLVDLSKPTLKEQQRTNFEQAVELALTVRELQPEAVNISIGGEIGEVGTPNSTVEELVTYMDGFNETLAARSPGTEGLSKISVQSGTTHGGVVLADWRARSSTVRPRFRIARSTIFRARRRRRYTSRRTSRRCCSTTSLMLCAKRSTNGCGRTPRTSASRLTPTSSSSTRPGRRRSDRSRNGSGIFLPT